METVDDEQGWWHVDLGSSIDIGLIKIFNRTEAPERLAKFYVFVSDTDMSTRSIANSENDPAVDHAYISGQADALREISNIGSGRFVKVQLSGKNLLSLAEVEVYEPILP